MDNVVGKGLSVVLVHGLGMVVFYILWKYIITPMFELPTLDWRDTVSIYLMIDVLFFILSKFDN